MKMLFLLSRNFKGDCLLQVYFVKVKEMGKNTLVDSRMLKLAKRMVCLIDLFILALIVKSRGFFFCWYCKYVFLASWLVHLENSCLLSDLGCTIQSLHLNSVPWR